MGNLLLFSFMVNYVSVGLLDQCGVNSLVHSSEFFEDEQWRLMKRVNESMGDEFPEKVIRWLIIDVETDVDRLFGGRR